MTMPLYSDRSQLQNAITTQALPALERLAANPRRLDISLNRRFERVDPPPYVSSSESEGEEDSDATLEEFEEALEEPEDFAPSKIDATEALPPQTSPHPAQHAEVAPAPPLRRSARNTNLHLPLETAATRGTKAVRAAPTSRKARATAEPPKKKGRPRKTQAGAITKPAAPPDNRGRKPDSRTAAAVFALDGEAKRGGGRPRRTQ
ncbi:hypothetical protein C8A00DRAFT_36909 [Chaetomidium leptoderma]|uniref:Uncharacterized protein n=1 Tax=Chaetomidium leptoderma TaxID=669021 RepID=A0AAN6VGQ4_9PEZI|nr:hypothetical protein C8A00DRAFT_36909 [Chaetomidium leptoderma]